MKRWAELPVDKKDVWVEKLKLSEILGHEICITGFETGTSRYGDDEYIKIIYTLDGQRHFTNTGSKLIQKQLEACKDDLPILATIVKKENWYSLS